MYMLTFLHPLSPFHIHTSLSCSLPGLTSRQLTKMDAADLAALAKAGEQMFVLFSLHLGPWFDETLQTLDQGSFSNIEWARRRSRC